MKTLTLFLTIGFLSLCTSTYSQVTTNDHQQANPKPTITKGYYSIGNNAKKLNASCIDRTRKNTIKSIPEIQKGFYSIANNNKQLQKNKIVVTAEKTSKPNIKKGYYSIGSNSEKLK